MVTKRANPHRIKKHRSYSVPELAVCLAVHANTVRQWQREGLQPLDKGRPVLFHGEAIRAFLSARNAGRKRPCPAGTLYCFKCREPRAPVLGLVEFAATNAATGNIRAICATCETIMHRRARKASLTAIMPGYVVQMTEAPLRLKGSPLPTLNSALERQAVT